MISMARIQGSAMGYSGFQKPIIQMGQDSFSPGPIGAGVNPPAPPVFFKNRDEFKYSAYLAGWGSDSGEMSNPLRALAATPNREKGMGGTNRGRYSNPAMDAKLEEAMRTVDDAKRETLLQEASRLAIADYGLLPLYFELSVWAMRRDLTYAGRADQATLAQFVQPKIATR